MQNFERLRNNMIERHLKVRGIKDPVLQAMRKVPREEFVPETMVEFADEDSPLPIGEGQTISQPYIVAAMTQLLELEKNDRVLEIGTGSGYTAAAQRSAGGEGKDGDSGRLDTTNAESDSRAEKFGKRLPAGRGYSGTVCSPGRCCRLGGDLQPI